MEKFKIGDIVFSELRGKGQIIEIPGYTQNRETAFVSAVFYKDGAVVVFTADGRESPDEPVTLYHYDDEEKVELNFKPFDKILYLGNDSRYYPGLFSYYIKRGENVFCCLIGSNILHLAKDVIPYKGNEKIALNFLKES